MNEPTAARQFASDAINADWNVLVQHGTDTGENPFVSIEAIKTGRHLRLTWHTRETGTYRLFSCALGNHNVTLTKAREELTR